MPLQTEQAVDKMGRFGVARVLLVFCLLALLSLMTWADNLRVFVLRLRCLVLPQHLHVMRGGQRQCERQQSDAQQGRHAAPGARVGVATVV